MKTLSIILINFIIIQTLHAQFEFGSNGSGDGQFSGPDGIAMDASDNVYVSDVFNSRVQKFDSDGNFISEFSDSFMTLSGIVVDQLGDIYVVDNSASVIYKYNASFSSIGTIGTFGSGDGQLTNPTGINIDQAGNIYVVDHGNNRVQKFDSNGNFLMKFGSMGSNDGEFEFANNIYVDADGNIYLTDDGNDRVQKFDSDGNFLMKFGSNGSGAGEFSGPYGIAVANDGDIYVSDVLNNTLQIFNSSGVYQSSLGFPGASGVGALSGPKSLSINSEGEIFVSNYSNDEIQVFTGAGGPSLLISSLPVNWVSFTADSYQGKALLKWQTAGEKDNSGFQVERSLDAKNWEVIGFVNGNGTTDLIQNYQFIDQNPLNGNNYYRLKQIDTDGKFDYSKIESVNIAASSQETVSLYPNPAKNNIKINTHSLTHIIFYDAKGRTVKRLSVDQNESIDISDLQSGMYTLKIMNDVQQSTKKLVKI